MITLTPVAQKLMASLEKGDRKVSTSSGEYRVFLALADMGLVTLGNREQRNGIVYYTATIGKKS